MMTLLNNSWATQLSSIVLMTSLGFLSQMTHATSTPQWQQTIDQGAGDTVYWHAWGGDVRTNDFITWVGEQTEILYDVKVKQVKLSSTSEAVTQVLAEKAAGQNTNGAVDMIWINGANFLAMKEQELLHGPFVTDLPNSKYLNLGPNAPATVDFTEAVAGLEVPWRLARFVFIVDSKRVAQVPLSMAQMLTWAKANPGRLTHPVVSNFMGQTVYVLGWTEGRSDPLH